MKILICSEYFLPHIGGVEQHSLAIANLIRSNSNNECIVATSLLPGTKRVEIKKQLKIYRFDISGNLVKGFRGEIENYKKFLLENNFDQIFFNACQQWTFDLSLSIINKIKSKKILFPCGFSRMNNFLYYPYFDILKNEINKFDKIICVSKKWKDYKFCRQYYKKKIDIISNTNFNKLTKITTKNIGIFNKLFEIKKYNFLNISNIKFLKGQDRTIKIFNNINKNNLNLFMIYSKSSSSLLFLIYIYIYSTISNFFNKIYNKKIYLINRDRYNFPIENIFYENSDFFLFGSRLEYSPLVFFESLDKGLYFYSFDVGILKDFKYLKKLTVENSSQKIIKKLNSFSYKKVNKKVFSNYNSVIKKYKIIFNLK